MFTIAIQPDDYHDNDMQSCWRWRDKLTILGHEVKYIDLLNCTDLRFCLQKVDGVMWRFPHKANFTPVAKRILEVLQHDVKIPIYPNINTYRHYDDKIMQSYLFDVYSIPQPKWNIAYRRDDALAMVKTLEYPQVLKLTSGAGSKNVALINNYNEARTWVLKLFNVGVYSIAPVRSLKDYLTGIARAIKYKTSDSERYTATQWSLSKCYIYMQEYLPLNKYDTRITVIGNRAFGFRRYNRTNDFRASGSGLIDYDPSRIDVNFAYLAFSISDKLKMQSCAIDGLYNKRGECVVNEVSYAYTTRAVYECPGYWLRTNDEIEWISERLWPEHAQAADFVEYIQKWKSLSGI